MVETLPQLFTEKEAAEYLGCSISTIRRERRLGRIGCTYVGRRPRYTTSILNDYLQNQQAEPCHRNENSASAKLEASGFRNAPTARSGVALGLTQVPDKRAAHLLAQRTFGKRS
ncbi:MAG: helix-turn-helix domain-containing protein [Paracoccaceae bacterium]